MILGLCTIQRDRGPWIIEWLAFHYIVGFRKFFFYAHHCSDNTKNVLLQASSHFDIKIFFIDELMSQVQLKAYQHAYDNFGHEVDWMAFIDGDEFLFPAAADDLRDVLEDYHYSRISAIAAYWVCFGSNGHIQEPAGLVVDNYTKRPPLDFHVNRHIKSIVMGRQKMTANLNAHIFDTLFGTYDELMRPITNGFMENLAPSYEKLRINHYVCQSYEYYHSKKNSYGFADAGQTGHRPDDWWVRHDINDHSDFTVHKFRDRLVNLINDLN